MQNSLYVQVLRSPILAALLCGTPAASISQTLRRGTRNGITKLLRMAPPIFDWAAITLGSGPHSSSKLLLSCVYAVKGQVTWKNLVYCILLTYFAYCIRCSHRQLFCSGSRFIENCNREIEQPRQYEHEQHTHTNISKPQTWKIQPRNFYNQEIFKIWLKFSYSNSGELQDNICYTMHRRQLCKAKKYWGSTILSPQYLEKYWGKCPHCPYGVGAYAAQ